jgi:ABC-type molybdate transport system ATPase subunit
LGTEVPTAFLSYSRTDSEFALRLSEDLKAAGAAIWLDQTDIDPGEEWDLAVERALLDCPRMLVILSPVSVVSPNVRDEISFALKKRKTIIPVLY